MEESVLENNIKNRFFHLSFWAIGILAFGSAFAPESFSDEDLDILDKQLEEADRVDDQRAALISQSDEMKRKYLLTKYFVAPRDKLGLWDRKERALNQFNKNTTPVPEILDDKTRNVARIGSKSKRGSTSSGQSSSRVSSWSDSSKPEKVETPSKIVRFDISSSGFMVPRKSTWGDLVG